MMVICTKTFWIVGSTTSPLPKEPHLHPCNHLQGLSQAWWQSHKTFVDVYGVHDVDGDEDDEDVYDVHDVDDEDDDDDVDSYDDEDDDHDVHDVDGHDD